MKRLAFLALLLAPASSFAIPVLWSLDGTFYRGGGASGSFVYDADTQTFSDVALLSFGSPSGGLAFTNFAAQTHSGLIFFQPGASSNDAQTIALELNGVFFSSLTNAGGLVTVNPSTNTGYFAEFSCGGVDICTNGWGSAVSNWYMGPDANNLLTGTVLGNTSVSEPGTLALLGAGCFAMFVMTRRRRADQNV
jgi:PEP-CTERM motif